MNEVKSITETAPFVACKDCNGQGDIWERAHGGNFYLRICETCNGLGRIYIKPLSSWSIAPEPKISKPMAIACIVVLVGVLLYIVSVVR